MPIESPRRNEAFGENRPDFDCKFYTMTISDDPNGFELTTVESLPRRDDFTNPLPKELEANWKPVLDSEGNQVFRKDGTTPLRVDLNPNRDTLRIGMQAQMRNFTRAILARDLLHAYRKDPTPENLKKFKEAQAFTKTRNTHTTGIRQIRRDKNDRNKIGVVLRPVSFHMYNNFSYDRYSDELLQMAANTSTTVALITTDNKLVIQHRSSKNTGWADTPAASASGYLDEVGFESKNGRRVLKPIDTNIAIDNAVRELEEEIGIGRDKLSSIKLAAMVHERERVHDEFLYVAKSTLTSEQMREESRKSDRNVKLPDEEFREKYDFIDATPEAIEALLTEVLCPIPYSHSAGIVAAGYSLMLERSGTSEAQKWKTRVEEGIENNYKRIDSLVKGYYERNPNKKEDIPTIYQQQINQGIEDFVKQRPGVSREEIEAERAKLVAAIPKRNLSGFSSAYSPSEQGLPGYESEMKRVGLTKST